MGYGREKCNGNDNRKCNGNGNDNRKCNGNYNKKYGRREKEKKCVCEFSNLEKLIKCFNESYEEYREELANASMFAKRALEALKNASEANGQTLENGKNIAAWIEKCGSKYDYNFDDCECVKIAEQLEEILCEINEELSEAAKELCDAIEEIADVEDLNDEFEEALQEYVECVQENDDESCEEDESSSEEDCYTGKKHGQKSGYGCKVNKR